VKGSPEIHYETKLYEHIMINEGKKVKLSLFHEGVWGSGCRNPYFLDLGTSWR
jgi:hypothetical protein